MCVGYLCVWVKLVLVLFVGVGVWLLCGSLVGLDVGVVLLIVVFIFKLVEMKICCDVLVLVFFGFFVVVVGYLFDDGFFVVLYSLLLVIVLLVVLIGL